VAEPKRTPTRKPAGWSYETRVLVKALLVGVPGMAGLALLMFIERPSSGVLYTLVALVLVLWLSLAFSLKHEIVYHLQTLSNLLEALREGDYSLRGRRAARDDALGEVVWEVNALGQTLREQRLEAREASALLQKVIAEIEIAVFAFDGRRVLQFTNPAGERLLARAARDIVGLTARELDLDDLLEGPRLQSVQRGFASGSGRWDVRWSSFREGGLPHYLLVVTDLSRALREEERKAWQRLIRVIGHELNNSLAPIKSMASTLKSLVSREPLPGDWREDVTGGLGVVADRAEALSRFMSAYALLARLPAPRRRPTAIAPLVNRVVTLESRSKVSAEGPAITIEVDGDQLEQSLINLVKNAVDATEGQGQVSVRWQQTGSGTVIEVVDDGPGIANADNLFVPFFTTKPGGSGIGLVLCRQIAEGHGGTLTLENRVGARGCVARLTLP
jgi:two-component system nitrogen regulation sensor histidine kinase NtrY